MLTASVVRSAKCVRSQVLVQLKRNIGVSAVLAQQKDLIQDLFVSKVREYAKLTKAAGGKMPDADPASQKSLTDQLNKLANQYAVQPGKEQEFAKFPKFEFIDSKSDLKTLPVNAEDLDAEVLAAE